MKVFVIGSNGIGLMPTTPRKARTNNYISEIAEDDVVYSQFLPPPTV